MRRRPNLVEDASFKSQSIAFKIDECGSSVYMFLTSNDFEMKWSSVVGEKEDIAEFRIDSKNGLKSCVLKRVKCWRWVQDFRRNNRERHVRFKMRLSGW